MYEFKEEDAFGFARHIGIEAKVRGGQLHFKTCPYCKPKATKDNMNTFACKRIEINRQCCNQGFTFTCFHFGNVGAMQRNTTDNLHRIMCHTQYTCCCFAANRKSIWQDIVQSFAIAESFFKHICLIFKFCIRKCLIFVSQSKNFIFYRFNFFEFF